MILVTGATGLVGGNLLWFLLQENDRVLAIRRHSSNLESLRTIFSFYTPNPDEYLKKIDWKIADVLDINSIREAMQTATVVYHCAAVVSLGSNSNTLSDTNVEGTKNIVRAAIEANVQRFCFVSSIAASGRELGAKKTDENSEWYDNPDRSAYSQSKYLSEQEVWNGIRLGLKAVIVNPGVILGVSGNNSGSSQLFSQVRKGLIFYTGGGTGYVDVRDVAKAMILLTKSKISGERFILVGENCSNKDTLSWMADGFGRRRPFIKIGKKTLWLVGILFELAGKLFHFRPLIDRGTARSAINQEFYSSKKIETAINFQFTPIKNCIYDVCKFQLRNNN